jgi:polyisoprenoid-binding protein YceI
MEAVVFPAQRNPSVIVRWQVVCERVFSALSVATANHHHKLRNRMRVYHLQYLAVALAATVMVSCGDVGDAPEASTGDAVTVAEGAGGQYRIDTTRSKVEWKAAKVTNAHDGGFREYDGTVTVNGDSVTAVRLNINTTSIWADNEKLTGHLKSDDFFQVEKHPTATFEADRFARIDSGGMTHMVTGNLTMLGNSKAVTFPAAINVANDVVTAKADFIINRKDWGIVYTGAPDDLIRDDVRIIFDITATKAQPTAMR